MPFYTVSGITKIWFRVDYVIKPNGEIDITFSQLLAQNQKTLVGVMHVNNKEPF
jgi:hypothetical protein